MRRPAVTARLVLALAAALPLPGHADLPRIAVSGPGLPTGLTLTLDDLDAMPQESFVTTTVWTSGPHLFSGVALKEVIRQLGPGAHTAAEVEATGIDGFSALIPLETLEEDAPILATRVDGAPIPTRRQGPFWIVYPYDSAARYRGEAVLTRSVWSLVALAFR